MKNLSELFRSSGVCGVLVGILASGSVAHGQQQRVFTPTPEEVAATQQAFEAQKTANEQYRRTHPTTAGGANAGSPNQAVSSATGPNGADPTSPKAAAAKGASKVAKKAPSRPGWPPHFSAWATLGLAMGASTSYSYTAADGTSTSLSDKGSTTPSLGLELDYRFHKRFSLGAALEYTKYSYSGESKSDTELGFYLVPRGQLQTRFGEVWLGLGLGLMSSGVGSGGAPVTAAIISSSASSVGFAISPRLGIDVDLVEPFIIGGQFEYTICPGSVSVGSTSSSSSTTTSSNSLGFTRKWMSFLIRVGMWL